MSECFNCGGAPRQFGGSRCYCEEIARLTTEAQTLAGQVSEMRECLKSFSFATWTNGACPSNKAVDLMNGVGRTHTERLVKAAMELADAANEAELAWDVNDMDWYDAAVAKRDKSICAYRALKEGK